MTRENGSRQQNVRQHNRALVLRAVLNEGVRSRTELAERLGLTRMALSNLAGELLADGILTETESAPSRAGAGRRSVGLALSPDAPLVCGALIRRGELRTVLCDLAGTPLLREDFRFSGLIPPDEARRVLRGQYERLARDCGRPILAVGVAAAGPLNVPAGTAAPDGLFDRPEVFDAAGFYAGISGRPVFLCNDATAGALGERLFGAGRGEDNFVYISTLNGIGAGLFLDGRLYNAGIGQNGELGHMSIQFDGPRCACGGRGCLELYADPGRILASNPDYAARYPRHPFFGGETPSFPELHRYAGRGDPLACEVLREYCRYLAFAVRNLGAQLSVGLVVLAGAPDAGGRVFERTLREQLGREQSAICPPLRVTESPFGMDAPLYGSAGIVIERVFEGLIDPVPGRSGAEPPGRGSAAPDVRRPAAGGTFQSERNEKA